MPQNDTCIALNILALCERYATIPLSWFAYLASDL